MTASTRCRDILVVDDSATLRRYLKITLERDGYDVRVCSDASEACLEIDARTPDFILSDWQMPNMNGVELCQWVRQQPIPQYIYFLLMTADTRVFDLVDDLDAGADDYVQKPIQTNELLTRIRCGERILKLDRGLRSVASDKADQVLQDLM